MPGDDVPMEIDQLAAAIPITPTAPRVSIPETTVQALGAFLEAVLVPLTLDPGLVLGAVWSAVHKAFLQDETMNTRLADEGQFLENVNEIGKESFIYLLRDMARRQAWRDLLENGTYTFRLISSTLIVPCFQGCF
jgi:hypothetical protein